MNSKNADTLTRIVKRQLSNQYLHGNVLSLSFSKSKQNLNDVVTGCQM